jgi:hypothetical protein
VILWQSLVLSGCKELRVRVKPETKIDMDTGYQGITKFHAKKSNGIMAIPKLLNLLDVKGAVIRIEAVGCQKEIAQKVRKKQATPIFFPLLIVLSKGALLS